MENITRKDATLVREIDKIKLHGLRSGSETCMGKLRDVFYEVF
jgi:hypothetical protein